MKTLTPEIQVKLKEKQDKIINKLLHPDNCWHESFSNGICKYCGALVLKSDNLSYSFNSLGWFDLFNWLTKEKLEWWEKLIDWSYYHHGGYDFNILQYIINNLPQLFVEWLWVTETGWRRECKAWSNENNLCRSDCMRRNNCQEYGLILTPLGKLMEEIK